MSNINDEAFRQAAKTGSLSTIQYLAADQVNYDLVHAAREGNLQNVKNALKNGADVHYNNDDALIWAARNGHFDVVKLLVKNNANISARFNEAIKWAERNGHNEIYEYLTYKLAKNDNAYHIAETAEDAIDNEEIRLVVPEERREAEISFL